jgi:hypothetical protein
MRHGNGFFTAFPLAFYLQLVTRYLFRIKSNICSPRDRGIPCQKMGRVLRQAAGWNHHVGLFCTVCPSLSLLPPLVMGIDQLLQLVIKFGLLLYTILTHGIVVAPVIQAFRKDTTVRRIFGAMFAAQLMGCHIVENPTYCFSLLLKAGILHYVVGRIPLLAEMQRFERICGKHPCRKYYCQIGIGRSLTTSPLPHHQA